MICIICGEEKMKKGDWVIVGGKRVRLNTNTHGSMWLIDQPIQGFWLWGEHEMRLSKNQLSPRKNKEAYHPMDEVSEASWICPRCDDEHPCELGYIIAPGAELKCQCGQTFKIAFDPQNDPDEDLLNGETVRSGF